MRVRIKENKSLSDAWHQRYIGKIFEVLDIDGREYYLKYKDHAGYFATPESFDIIEDTERDEILTKLAGYEYGPWVNWVAVGGQEKLIEAYKDKPMWKGCYWDILWDTSEVYIRWECIDWHELSSPYLYTIEEINLRKEELRTDLNNLETLAGVTPEIKALQELRADYWDFLELDGCYCASGNAPCSWCTHPGNNIEETLSDSGYSAGQIRMFVDDEPLELILSAGKGCEPKEENPWFPGRATVQRNIQAMMPIRRIERDCKDCIYYKYKQCVKELVNNGYCDKWRGK